MRCLFSSFLFIYLVMVFSSCTETNDIHPLYPRIFKVLESSKFVIVSDSLNDTITFNTQDFKYSYERGGAINIIEKQIINLDCTIEGDVDNWNLLKMYVHGDNSLKIELNCRISYAGLSCLNNTSCFTDNFVNEFELNGTIYKGCWFYNRTESNGELTTLLIFSQTYGVLKVVNFANGTVYNRCFECE